MNKDSTPTHEADHPVLPPYWEDLFAEPPSREVLPNGLTVVRQPRAGAGMASLQVWIHTGSIHEGDLLGSGLSHYLEHLLFKGTSRRGADAIAREAQGLGAQMNAYTTFDRTVYYLDVPCENISPALDLLGDLVANAKLDAEDIRIERDVILREIDMGLDDPDRMAGRALFQAAFRRHPYRYPVIGERPLFEKIEPEHLRSYYRKRYAPGNATLVLTGEDTDTEETTQAIEQCFGGWEARALAPIPIPDEPGQLAPRELHEQGDYQVERGYVAYRIPGIRHPDAPGLDTLATILGRGDSSRLWQSLRERQGLVHEIHASAWNPTDNGLFVVSYFCDPGKSAEVEKAIDAELRHLQNEGLRPEEIRKTIRQAYVHEINARKTPSGLAARLGMAEVVAGDLEYPHIYLQRLARIDRHQLRQLASRYFVAQNRCIVTYGPKARRVRGPSARSKTGPALVFEEVRLPNGVRLLLLPDDRLPRVHLRASLLAGALAEPPQQRGITELAASLMTGATEHRHAEQTAALVDENGATFRHQAGNNSLGLAIEVLPDDLHLAVELLRDGLCRPRFDAPGFENERRSLIAELQDMHDDVVTMARLALRERFFGEHPLALPSSGRMEDLQALDPGKLEAFHKSRLLKGDNLVLAVSGRFDRGTLTPLLEASFGGLERGFEDPRNHREPPSLPAQPGDHRLEQPRQQAVVLDGYPGHSVDSEDTIAADLLHELLSDMSGKLFSRVREELGLAYFVGAQRVIGLDAGMFFFYCGTQPGHEADVFAEFDAEVERIRQGRLGDDELQRARTALKAARRNSQQHLGHRCRQASLNCLFGLPPDFDLTYDRRLEQTGIEDLQRLAETWFRPDLRVRLTVRPGE